VCRPSCTNSSALAPAALRGAGRFLSARLSSTRTLVGPSSAQRLVYRMALLSARAPDVVLAVAGAWPSAPRVVRQGYLLNEAHCMAFEAWLRPKRLARRRQLLRFFAIYAETSPLSGFLFGVETRAPPQMAWSPGQLAAARRRYHLRPSPTRPCARTFYTRALLLTHIVHCSIVMCAYCYQRPFSVFKSSARLCVVWGGGVWRVL